MAVVSAGAGDSRIVRGRDTPRWASTSDSIAVGGTEAAVAAGMPSRRQSELSTPWVSWRFRARLGGVVATDWWPRGRQGVASGPKKNPAQQIVLDRPVHLARPPPIRRISRADGLRELASWCMLRCAPIHQWDKLMHELMSNGRMNGRTISQKPDVLHHLTGGIGQRFPVSGRILHPCMHHR